MRRIIIISIIVFGIVALLAALAMPSFIKYGEKRAAAKCMAHERAMQIQQLQYQGSGGQSIPGNRPNDTTYYKGHGKNPLKSGEVRDSSTLGVATQSNNR